MPRYQQGSVFRQIRRAEGMTWILRYYKTRADGKRVEHTVPNAPFLIGREYDERECSFARIVLRFRNAELPHA